MTRHGSQQRNESMASAKYLLVAPVILLACQQPADQAVAPSAAQKLTSPNAREPFWQRAQNVNAAKAVLSGARGVAEKQPAALPTLQSRLDGLETFRGRLGADYEVSRSRPNVPVLSAAFEGDAGY